MWSILTMLASTVLITGEAVNCPGLGDFPEGPPWQSLSRPIPSPKCNSNVRFFLLTRQNSDDPLEVSPSNLDESPFDSAQPVVFLFHGWQGSSLHMTVPGQQYLQCNNVNVFLVDYREVAADKNYLQAVSNIRITAALVARFVKYLIYEKGISKCNFHLCGISLGAQLASYVCKLIPGLKRLTGLDPAGPFFNTKDCRVRLSKTDAQFVEVVHTNMLLIYGTIMQDAHLNFIINDGVRQPGCYNHTDSKIFHTLSLQRKLKSFLDATLCSHARAVYIFMYSLCNKNCTFVGMREEKYRKALRKLNDQSKRINAIEENCLKEDDCVPYNLNTIYYRNRGRYFIFTTEKAPFCFYKPTTVENL